MWIRCVFFIFLCFFCGCDNKPASKTNFSKPVKVFTLKKEQPQRSLRLTGSAMAWRKENLAFEIAGRLVEVLNVNSSVGLIPIKQENGSELIQGEVIARLDSSRYDADETAARAQLESAGAQVKAIEEEINKIIPRDIERAETKVESLNILLEKILPQELKKARAELERSERDKNRVKRLYEQDSKSEQDYDQVQTRYKIFKAAYKIAEANGPFQQRELEAARADLRKARASLTVRQAQLKAARAKETIALAQLQIALINQDECLLRAPFSGIISARKVSKGAVVRPGQPVAEITIMDPVLINVALATKLARNIQVGDPIYVYPPALGGKALRGWVQRKSIQADPKTRTYNITCMVRNRLISSQGDSHHQKSGYIKKDDLAVIWRADAGIEESPLMIWTKSILRDEKGYYAWVIPYFILGYHKVNFRKTGTKKIYFELGEGFKSFGIRYFREITRHKGFKEGMLTVRGDLRGLGEGALTYIPTDWLMHPGDLLQISFDLGSYPSGVYAPIQAILSEKGKSYIFVLDRKKNIAKKVFVKTGEVFRDKRRITSDQSLENKEIVVFGAHYLKDQDPVNTVVWE